MWLRGTDGLSGQGLGSFAGAHDQSAHEYPGAARRTHPLGALAVGVRALVIHMLAGVDLFEGLVATTSGTIPKRLRHRGAPYNCVPAS
jgi:hypothetical protein